jgi:hypothetical protein
MQVKIINVDLEHKTALLTTETNKTCAVRLVLPNNKGNENDAWVDCRPIKVLFGDGDHKNWLTIPRKDTINTVEVIERETLKKPQLPLYVSIKNLAQFVTPDEYEICKQIFKKAELKLAESRLADAKEKAGIQVTEK